MRSLSLILAFVAVPGLAQAQLPDICNPPGMQPQDIKECKSSVSGSCDFTVKVKAMGVGATASCSIQPLDYKLICVRKTNSDDKPSVKWKLVVEGEGAQFHANRGIEFLDTGGDMADFDGGKRVDGQQGFQWSTTAVESPARRVHVPNAFNKYGSKPCTRGAAVSAEIVSTTK